MKKDLITVIQENKYHVVIVSPHLDDAVLSCAELLQQLSGRTSISIINVFTKAHKKPYTLSAKAFMKYSQGFTDANNLYQARIKEDKEVLAQLKIIPTNLNIEEALFRRRKNKSVLSKLLPEFDHVYPTYRWHIAKGVAGNDPAIAVLKKKLLPFKSKKNLVFAPYGIGSHADHLLVRKVCEELFDTYVLYSDFPYNRRLDMYGYPLENGEVYKIKPNREKKEILVKGYKTQFDGLFPSGIMQTHQEVYFSNTRL